MVWPSSIISLKPFKILNLMLECYNSNAWFSKVFHVRLQVWNTRTPHVNTNQSGLKDCADLAMRMRGTPLILIILASRQKTGVIRTVQSKMDAGEFRHPSCPRSQTPCSKDRQRRLV